MTFRAVAAFADAKLRRLLLLQAVVAAMVAVSVVWLLRIGWLPVAEEAMTRLPDRAEIRGARLSWDDRSHRLLAENRLLAIVVAPEDTATFGRMADVGFELRPDTWRVHSLFGFIELPYPRGWVIGLSRAEVEPWWGARKPWILTLVGAAVMLHLGLAWAVVAALYAPVVYSLAFFADRSATWAAAWRLAAAALLPGAVVMTGAIFLYGYHRLNLVGLLVAAPLHLALGWVYLIGATLALPRIEGASVFKNNPFRGD
jgi:hypothetical protein